MDHFGVSDRNFYLGKKQENYENLIPDFIDRNTPLDELRGESLYQVAPELEFFRDYE